MSTSSIVPLPDEKQRTAQPEATKRGRKSKQVPEEAARYFLGKSGSSSGRPELGEEASNKNQALIKAFQQTGVVYVVTSYRVEAEVQGGSPILVMRPLQKP